MREFWLRSVRWLAVATAAQVAVSVQAQPAADDDNINPDRPGIADGSNVVGAGRVQIETGLQHEYRNSDGRAARTFFIPTLVRLGIASVLELRLEGSI